MTKDNAEQLRYNDLQRTYYETRPIQHNHRMVLDRSPYVLNHVDHMIDLAGLQHGQRILDVGCGMGKFTIPLREKGFDVEGLDLSPRLLEMLNKEDPTIPTTCGDLHNLDPALHGKYDHVIGFFMLHHLFDLDKAFGQFAKLLKPNGRVSFIEPNPNCPLFWAQITFMPTMSWKAEKGIFNLGKRNLCGMIDRAGLKTPHISQYGILPPFLRNRPGAGAVERGFDKVAPLRPIAAFRRISAEL
ncbi:MAG: 2-polyprenyl-3-methyl-5-hydroxy-6-metoxy-1,4-benzoquinol methylase [Ascidiaceihabitans sp.]|jgi:2-polyprenyl-3-methyl-5-hydroxy-6-metoxy-1,4-benzoquinol methylase